MTAIAMTDEQVLGSLSAHDREMICAASRLGEWDHLPREKQLLYARHYRDRWPLPVLDPVGAKSGVTQANLLFIGDAVFDALLPVLPEIVAGLVQDAVHKLAQPMIERAIAHL